MSSAFSEKEALQKVSELERLLALAKAEYASVQSTKQKAMCLVLRIMKKHELTLKDVAKVLANAEKPRITHTRQQKGEADYVKRTHLMLTRFEEMLENRKLGNLRAQIRACSQNRIEAILRSASSELTSFIEEVLRTN